MPNQPSTFQAKNWVEVNEDARRRHNTKGQIKFKTSVLKSRFCDYRYAYLLVKGNIATTGNVGPPVGRTDAQLVAPRWADKGNKKVVF